MQCGPIHPVNIMMIPVGVCLSLLLLFNGMHTGSTQVPKLQSLHGMQLIITRTINENVTYVYWLLMSSSGTTFSKKTCACAKIEFNSQFQIAINVGCLLFFLWIALTTSSSRRGNIFICQVKPFKKCSTVKCEMWNVKWISWWTAAAADGNSYFGYCCSDASKASHPVQVLVCSLVKLWCPCPVFLPFNNERFFY